MSTPAEVRAATTAAAIAAAEAAEAAALANAAALEVVQATQAAALLAAQLEDEPTPGPEPEPEPEPPPSGRPRFGYYPAANTGIWDERVKAFEATTGIDIEQVGGNQDQRYEGARGSVLGVFSNNVVGVTAITCAIQLAFTGGPYGTTLGQRPGAVKRAALQATIDGKNDDIYQANVTRMKGSRWQQIILRLGSEGDIPFPPHSFHPGTEAGATGNDDLYRAAYAHVHKIFKGGLGDRVRFSYTTTAFAAERKIVCHDGQTRTALAAGYPGDELVDIVGIDAYLGEPLTTVQRLVKAGIEFAKVHRKPAALDEWGINPKGLERPEAEQCTFVHWVPTLPLEYASFFGGWAGREGKPGSWWPDDYTAPVRDCMVMAWE